MEFPLQVEEPVRQVDGIMSKNPEYGLHTIVDRDSAATETIDIVAIHGLNGDYLRTWTDEAASTSANLSREGYFCGA